MSFNRELSTLRFHAGGALAHASRTSNELLGGVSV